MRIWVDLANSPHVPFFQALIKEFLKHGHEVETTARDFAETLQLARAAGLESVVVGEHGGRKLRGKASNLVGRAWLLGRWAHRRKFDLAVSHNSYAQIVAARALRLRRVVTLMDYEHQPANHLAFRLASRVIVPRCFPDEALRHAGAGAGKVKRYNGIKEDVYLADFQPDPGFAETLRALGVARTDVLVVVRPPARDALYHRFDNSLFDELLERLTTHVNTKVVLLARGEAQRRMFATRYANSNVLLPESPLDGRNLVAHADLVVSAGGTMNREAAALGVPAWSIYAGRWAAVDEDLMRQGRLRRISTREEIQAVRVEKKKITAARRAHDVRAEVVKLILE